MMTTDDLDQRISTLVSALVESAPQAPPLPQLDEARRMRHFEHPRRLVVGAVGVVALALVLGFEVPQSNGHRQIAASVQLRAIADLVSAQTSPQLQAGQYLLTKQKVSFNVQLGPPNADATLVESTSLWSNADGGSCLQATVGAPQFSSTVDREAWQALGSPYVQAAPAYCSFGKSAQTSTLDDGSGAIDVSSLSTNPAILASELEAGTTGVSAIDELTPGQTQTMRFDAGFERAVTLLVGPTTGGSPTFRATVFRAMSSMPQVTALGPMTSHEGLAGVGFAGASSLNSTGGDPATKTVIIVDPNSGDFLEAQNVVSGVALRGNGPESLVALMPSLPGGPTNAIVGWVDPIGSPTVVDAGSLPPGASIDGS